MNSWEIIGGIVAILTLAVSVIVHLIKTTWAMAAISTTVEISFRTVNDTLTEIKKELSLQRNNCVVKDVCMREMAFHEKEIENLTQRVEEIIHDQKRSSA